MAIFDDYLPKEIKVKMVEIRKTKESEIENMNIRKASVSQDHVKNVVKRNISQFFNLYSLNLFSTFHTSSSFLAVNPELWNIRDDYKQGRRHIGNLRVTLFD